MANTMFESKLREGAIAWNAWRASNPLLVPDLEFCDLGLGARQFSPVCGEPVNLSRARLTGANLRHATLSSADLSHALLIETDLENARLDYADLRGATLSGAILFNADVTGALFEGAILDGADLRYVRNLTQAQAETASGDRDTLLPPWLVRPDRWVPPPPQPVAEPPAFVTASTPADRPRPSAVAPEPQPRSIRIDARVEPVAQVKTSSTAGAARARAELSSRLPKTRVRANPAAPPRKPLTAEQFYRELGLTRDASIAEIRAAYRARAKQLHPDRNGDPHAGELFKSLSQAVALFSDPSKRKLIDRGELDAAGRLTIAGYQQRKRAASYRIFAYSFLASIAIGSALSVALYPGRAPKPLKSEVPAPTRVTTPGGGHALARQHQADSVEIATLEAGKDILDRDRGERDRTAARNPADTREVRPPVLALPPRAVTRVEPERR